MGGRVVKVSSDKDRPEFKTFLKKSLKDKEFKAELERLMPELEAVERAIKEKDNE
jgi:hypothetical protein